MFSRKCQVLNYHISWEKIYSVDQNVNFTLSLESQLPFLSFDHFFVLSVWLIHFTGGMLPAFTIYPRYPIHIYIYIYIQYILHIQYILSLDNTCLGHFWQISRVELLPPTVWLPYVHFSFYCGYNPEAARRRVLGSIVFPIGGLGSSRYMA